MNLLSLPSSFDSYIRHGWCLVPIPNGYKGPQYQAWNEREKCLTDSAAIPPGYGVGLAHAYSGTMALDIDDWDKAKDLLIAHQIDLQALFDAPDAVQVLSGKQGHGKLLYAMPFGLVLPTKKIIVDGVTVYELRCGTREGLTVQDVLPPTIHPETLKPYQWSGKGDWQHLPVLPIPILDLWQKLLDGDKSKQRELSPMTADGVHWTEIKSALYAVPANCSRDEWIQIGMALHAAAMLTNDEPGAFQLWHDWSATGVEKFKGLRDLESCWRSFRVRDHGIGLGTLFHIAFDYGWTRPRQDVAHLFKPTVKSVEDFLGDLQVRMPQANLDLFPPVLRQRAQEVAISTGCNPLLPIWAGMAVVSGAVDKRSRLRIVDDFEVPPVLWVMCVGAPSEMKSPGTKPMFAPLHMLEKEDRPRYQRDLLVWEAQEALYSASKASYLKAASAPERVMLDDTSDTSDLPPVSPKPIEPVPLRMTVKDITSQKLARMIGQQQSGLMVHLDEMQGWITKVCDPRSSDDRSTWTSGFEGSEHSIDRVGLEAPILIDSFAFAMFGNVQPKVYAHGQKLLQTDGLLQRFIPIPLKKSTKLSQPIPSYLQNTQEWEDRIRAIHALPTQTYTLSHEAYEVFRDFQNWHTVINKEHEYVLGSDDLFMEAYGKMTGLCGRIAFILHLLESPAMTVVQASTVQQAVNLIRSYVIPAYRYMTSNATKHEPLAVDMLRYIIQVAPETDVVKPVDFQRSLRSRFGSMLMRDIRPMLERDAIDIEEAGYIVRMPGETRDSVQWFINPIVKVDSGFDALRKRIAVAKKARQLEVENNMNDYCDINGKLRPRMFKPVIGLGNAQVSPQRDAHDGLTVPEWDGLPNVAAQ